MAQLSFGTKINVRPCCSKHRLFITVRLNSFMLRMGAICFHVQLLSWTRDLRVIFINTHEYRSWAFLIRFIRPLTECLRTKAPDILSVLTKGMYQLLWTIQWQYFLLRVNEDSIIFPCVNWLGVMRFPRRSSRHQNSSRKILRWFPTCLREVFLGYS